MLLTSTLCQYSLSIDYIVQQQQAIVKLITINHCYEIKTYIIFTVNPHQRMYFKRVNNHTMI